MTADYKLTPADSKTFDMGKAIKVLRVDTRPSNDLYTAYITYFETAGTP